MRKPTVSRSDIVGGDWMTVEQCMIHFQIDREGILQLATQAGAIVKFGRRTRLYRPLIDSYLLAKYRVKTDGTENE